MDRSCAAHTRGERRPSLVEIESPDMEWIVLDPTTNSNGRLHGRVRDRLGHCDREPLMVRIVVDASTSSSHQCQGAPHGIHGDGSPGMQRQDAEHNMRQYIDHRIHQSLRGHSIARIAFLGNEAVGRMPQDGDAPQDHVYPISIQPSRCAVSPTHGSTGVVDQPLLLLTDGSEVGATQGGPVCVGTEPPPTTVHVVEAMPKGNSVGCTAAALETLGPRLLLPSVEPHPSSPSEDPTGEGGSDSHHTVLEVSTLVPDDTNHVNHPTHSDSEGGSDTGTGKRARHFSEKSDVVAYCMEHKRQALMRMGADDSVIAMWNNNKARKRTLMQRAGPQLQYIRWALARDVDPLTPNAASLLNFLVSGVTLGKWSESTTNTYKSQIIQLYEDQSAFQTELFRSSVRMIQARAITDFKALDLDLTPAIRYLENLPANSQLSMEQITRKLCWLLAVVGMFRGDDIACIDIAHTHFRVTSQVAILPVVLPKEKRRRGRIRKFTTIQAHTNPALCPVATLQEYISRLPSEEDLVPHHKDSDILIRPLVRDRRNVSKAVGSDTINRHISSITDLLERPASSSRPRARAIAASAAFKNDAPKDDILVQANWSSSVMFDSFYRLSGTTSTNFTTTVLP